MPSKMMDSNRNMNLFRERNKIQKEYSGYQQASEGLRGRLATIVDNRSGYHMGLGNENYYLSRDLLDHETKVRLNKNCLTAIRTGTYDEVFDAIEMFLTLVHSELYSEPFLETLKDIITAFQTAGSVYEMSESGQVLLKISEETATNIESAEEQIGARSTEALDFFRRAFRDLLTCARKPNDIVKDFAVAIEDYVMALVKNKDYKKAITLLREQGIIVATQQGVLDKLYAYRGDAHGVAHTGNTEEPDEADAVWFLETLVAQVKLIEAKIKAMTINKRN